MARMKPKQLPEGTTYLNEWENKYKPRILTYFQVPIEVVAEVLGTSINTVQEQLRSGLYDYGVARPCPGGTTRYEVLPLRLIAYIEGRLVGNPNIISHQESY
jgi:hypothetical protein